MHRHKAACETTKCFSGPIRGAKPNPSAHGNICVTEWCACGATREINVNQSHVEQGKWSRQPPQFDETAHYRGY